ncbi:PAN2-PAN3 deadenylation complex catalytic subunit PAN2-like isoform X2 [Littorina saxatilis]|uniref:PAN2-PAN3 deadenylation complex catalytic subunit PAN2-like isoform X2 n=1 Tax=Littorina saxatilis TaxID=31220 RepID=UPI0038B69F2C
MNFQGSPLFGGGSGVHQGQDMMVDPNMLGSVGAPEGFHEGQNMGPVFTPNVVAEMDYRPVLVKQASINHLPVTACSFDSQELLWAGTQRGHVTSYYGMQCEKHSAFHVSSGTDTQPEVRQLLAVDGGVLSLTSTRLRLNLRRAQAVYAYTDSDMQQMQCMIQTSPDTIIMGGHQKKVIEFNALKGQVVNKYEVGEAGCAVFRQSGKYLCAGDATGKVTLYDASTMRKEHVLDAHSSMLSDFDVQRNLLVTCGLSTRLNQSRMDNQLVADRLLMVYDMRVMRAMAPIQVDIDPTFLRFVPALSHHLVVVSQMGSFQLTDSTSVSQSMMIYPVDTHGAGITSFDLSKTCQAMAFGDSAGYCHLFANNEHAVFSGLDLPTEFADHPEPPHHEMHLMDEIVAFATVPTFYPANDSLLSEWPSSMMKKICRKPRPIDPEILRSMKVMHNVCCVPNPKKGRRNQAPYKIKEENGAKRQLSVPESPIGEDPFKTVPKEYQRMLMRYTKLDDFDFRHYNKTHFAGLTAEYNNSYCNALLQILYFVEPLRAALLSHICQREFCLACELGFLFHMLDTKKGEACQAKNFLRAFRTLTEAAALGLLLTEAEEINGSANFLTLIPRWHRFVIQQVNSETSQQVEVASDSPTKETDPSPPAQPEAAPEKKTESGGGKGRKKKNKRGKKKEETKEESKTETADKEGEDGSGEDSLKSTQEEQQEEVQRMEEISVVKDLFFVNSKSELMCRCGMDNSKDEQIKITVLGYPPNPSPGSEGVKKVTFAELVHHSLTSDSTMQAYCNECKKYQMHIKRRKVTSLPDLLVFDCNLSNESNLNFWKDQLRILKKEKKETSASPNNENTPPKPKTLCRYGNACRRADCKYSHGSERSTGATPGDSGDSNTAQFDPSYIPLGLRITMKDDGDLAVEEVSDEESMPKEEVERRELYEVFAVVYVIEQQDAGRHLVSCIKVSEPYHQRKERVTCTQWYLFNDFCLEPIEKPENVSLDLTWKIPSVVYYTRRSFLTHHESTVSNWCQMETLYKDPALANPKRRKMTFLPMQPEETLSKGDLVGLDAEFISLKEEEAELRSDGTKSTIKPSHVSPGRVTCIRGQGDHFGEPFIDDYILTPEQVSDYLTEFSGIQPGELDPSTSTKHLTTLKSTYQKLRCLLDIGVVFVGHGLKKDFKVINVQVPKEQIVDTVQLFHMPNKRFISLRFLAWFFLDKNIQSGQHDSAEDARIALLLYKRYRELQAEGPDTVRASISELYETGRRHGWKVPDVTVSETPAWADTDNMWTGQGHDSEDDILDQTPGFFESQ